MVPFASNWGGSSFAFVTFTFWNIELDMAIMVNTTLHHVLVSMYSSRITKIIEKN